jgi:hypothetical protein
MARRNLMAAFIHFDSAARGAGIAVDMAQRHGRTDTEAQEAMVANLRISLDLVGALEVTR